MLRWAFDRLVSDTCSRGVLANWPCELSALAMARFLHEAVAVGPATGIAYQTEGNRNAAALDRYVPVNGSGALGSLQRGGALQAAGEGEGVPTAAYSSSTPQPA